MKMIVLKDKKATFNANHYYEGFYFDFIEFMSSYHKQAFMNPEKCVFIDSGIPSEIVFAMKLMPIMIETVPTLISSIKAKKDVFESADTYFYNSGTCSFSRYTLPAFERKEIPLPKAFVSTTVCKDMSNNIAMLARKYNIKHYCIDVPYKNNEESVTYLTKQYKGLIEFLAEISGEPIDWNHINKVLNNSAQVLKYMKAVNEMRKSQPALFYGGNMLRFRSINTLRGSDEAVDIMKDLYELMKERSEKHITPVQKENMRILWDGSSPLYERELFNKLEKEMGAIIVADPLCCFSYLDDLLEVEDPIESLARLMLANPLGSNNGKLLAQKVKEYNVDGVIHFGQLNCNVINSKMYLVKEELKEAGVPLLELTGDLVDQRNASIEQILTRVEAFVEMLL
ncbi:2-hydroxyacyl-CoA dehydratase subunit D [Cellulosilyticum ruminicola]|uniref:2-hydroxyacyl-CoA dehydratase subunit D n=1 Tax=Cellulosilyticum ruminicola TaxID=425254 RepID=UPI0006CFE398|nr:2-hydroxyacyl-CoA dehydratase family protein [Cellulosilyticum ruminicola]